MGTSTSRGGEQEQDDDPPEPVTSDEFWGGFSSGYEGPDRRRADRGAPGGGERRQR
jgi:hypothetical protein